MEGLSNPREPCLNPDSWPRRKGLNKGGCAKFVECLVNGFFVVRDIRHGARGVESPVHAQEYRRICRRQKTLYGTECFETPRPSPNSFGEGFGTAAEIVNPRIATIQPEGSNEDGSDVWKI